MSKSIPASGAGAVRTILKNKQDFHFDLREKNEQGTQTVYVYDVEYENVNGTMTIALRDDKISVASLNLSIGKVISLSLIHI